MPRILVVDDDLNSRNVYAMTLTGAGHEVRLAGDAEEALVALRQEAPELVVLDLDLAGSDGAEVLVAMRTYSVWRQIPVLLVTGLSEEAAARRVRPYGVAGILLKGRFSRKDLLGRVGEALVPPAATAVLRTVAE